MYLHLNDAPGKHKCDRVKAHGLLTIALVAGLYSFDFEPKVPNGAGGSVDEAVSGVFEHAEGLDAEALREKLSFYGIELFVPGDKPGEAPPKNLKIDEPQPPKEPEAPDYDKLKAQKLKGGADEVADAAEIEDFLAGFRRTHERDLKEYNEAVESFAERHQDWEKRNDQAIALYARWQEDRNAYLKKHRVGEPLVENPVTPENLSARNAQAATETRPRRRLDRRAAEHNLGEVRSKTSVKATPEFEADVSINDNVETAQQLGYVENKGQWSFGW